MKAYEVIEKYGWVQKRFGNEYDGFCVLGALLNAYYPSPKYWEMSEAIIQAIGSDIVEWNDRQERTKDQVITILKQVEL